jgi:hypothetical protein
MLIQILIVIFATVLGLGFNSIELGAVIFVGGILLVLLGWVLS